MCQPPTPLQECSDSAGTFDAFRLRVSKAIAKAVKSRRKLSGLSQLELSLMLRRGPKYIWRLENRFAEPDVSEFLAIMNALDADPCAALLEVRNFELEEALKTKLDSRFPSRQQIRADGTAMVRHYRILQGLSQAQLAARVNIKGMSQSRLSLIERDQAIFDLEEFIELIAGCGFDPLQAMADLLSGDWKRKTEADPPKPL